MDEKTNYWEILRKFSKGFLRQFGKTLYFKQLSLCFERKHKLFENFEKILKMFDKKFNRKIEFLVTFGKVVPKIRAFGNTIIFL